MKKTINIKLTPKQADLVWRNVDGWMDAGACEGGLNYRENQALQSLSDQISAQIHRGKTPDAAFAASLCGELVEEIEAVGFSWHSEDERKILDAIMNVILGNIAPPSIKEP